MGVTRTGRYSWRITTDEKHVIVVDSILVSSEWEKSAAYAGQKAYLLIYTAFVGHGSKLTLTCKTESGRTLSTIDVPMFNNYCRGAFDIPIDVDPGERIYFEVFSAPLKINGMSSSIPVFPVPYVENLAWSKEEVENQDILDLSADVYNVQNETPATITVYEFDPQGGHERLVDYSVPVKDNCIRSKWQFRMTKDPSKYPTREEYAEYGLPYNAVRYFFTVTIGSTEYGKENQDSGFIVPYGEKLPDGKALVLEADSALFNTGSAVLLPDNNTDISVDAGGVSGLEVILKIYKYVKDHPEKKLLLLGHTDAVGSSKDNRKLALARAQSLYYLLIDERDHWVKVVEDQVEGGQRKKYRDKDIRALLRWIAHEAQASWDCVPENDDDVALNEADRQAIRRFRTAHNEMFDTAYEKNNTSPGYWGWAYKGEDPGWGAVFDVIQAQLIDRFASDEDDIEPYREAVKCAVSWPKDTPDVPYCVLGCGEYRPKNGSYVDNVNSAADRRVEVFFLDPEEQSLVQDLPCQDESAVKTHCIPTQTSDKCPVYGKKVIGHPFFNTEPLEVTVPPEKLHVSLEILNEIRQPLKGAPYTLTLPDGERSGVTDGEGCLVENDVPPGDHPLEINDIVTFAPALPRSLTRRLQLAVGTATFTEEEE